MKSYASFCPVAKTGGILAERGTPLLLGELMMGARRFGEVQTGMPLISRAPLASRLAEVERGGIIVRATGERGECRWWLALNRPEVDVCIKHPRFEIDVAAVAQLRALTLVWLGFRGFGEARRAGEVAIAGEPRAVDLARAALGLRDEREPWGFDFPPRPDPFGLLPVHHATPGAP